MNVRPSAILFDMDNTLLQSNIDYAAIAESKE